MAYYIDLFSPETYEIFSKSNQDISGFRLPQEGAACRIRVGDKLICYMTKYCRSGLRHDRFAGTRPPAANVGRWVLTIWKKVQKERADELTIHYSINECRVNP